MAKKVSSHGWSRVLIPVLAGAVIGQIPWTIDKYLSWQMEKANARADLQVQYRADSATASGLGERRGYDLLLKNTGNRPADSIWLYQKYYLLSGDSDFECKDIPHFEYIAFAGSRRSMFTISEEKDTLIHIDFPCFAWAVGRLLKKFPGRLAMCWYVEFVSTASGLRERRSFTYLFDQLWRPLLPDERTGGLKAAGQIEEYERSGPQQLIKYVPIVNDFFLNPSNALVKNSQGKYELEDPHKTYPVGAEMLLSFDFDAGAIGYGGRHYLGFTWDCAGDSMFNGWVNSESVLY